ncbi:hypothetical protein BX257_2820 [Streptomyces sp. 3212.3]|uniref:HAAS signaling domain-containing protein n=1 Tax=Streptomyces sp. 3212.3 TaxID=1938846 RepID=UPI000E247C90|nr:hypothetical protein [Streptomyces sp. 3212.3]REE60293.1 hypothetical protein BX257_2820 [Streptomyces sp. 3212.3]
MTSERKQLIEEYLKRLDSASVALAPQRRAELREEIREHIDAATDEVEILDATAVRAILGRLGSPEEIVSAEQGPASTGSAPAVVLAPAPAAHLTETQQPPLSSTRNEGPEPAGSRSSASSKARRPGRKIFVLGAAATLTICLLALSWWALQSSHPNDAIHQPSEPTATSTP